MTSIRRSSVATSSATSRRSRTATRSSCSRSRASRARCRRSSSSRRTATSRRRRGSGVDPEVANCVADVIKGIEFPKPKGGGGVQVNYPFTFRPGGLSRPRSASQRTTAADRSPLSFSVATIFDDRMLRAWLCMVYRSRMKLLGAVARRAAARVAGCPNQARNDSKTLLNEGNKAHGAEAVRHGDQRVPEGRSRSGADNHLAWYGMGGAYAQTRRMGQGGGRVRATPCSVAPEQPMYQMWYGVSLYEKADRSRRARIRRAKRTRSPKRSSSISSAVNFEKAQQHARKRR